MPEIISRKEAIERGLKRYFTGKPCKRGHVAQRIISSWYCLECRAEKTGKIYRHLDANEGGERRQARALRLTRYFTGRPCKHGHVSFRITSDSKCQRCKALYDARITERRRENFKKRYWKNPEKFREQQRLWLIKDMEKDVPYTVKYKKEWRLKNKERLSRKKRSEAEKQQRKRAYYIGPKNPRGERQWLSKTKANLRNLRRALRRPNLDHSVWLKEDPQP